MLLNAAEMDVMACPDLVSAVTLRFTVLIKPFLRGAKMLRYLAIAGSATFGNNSLRFRSPQTVAPSLDMSFPKIYVVPQSRDVRSRRGFKTFDDRRVLRALSRRRLGVSSAGQRSRAMAQAGLPVPGLRWSFGDATIVKRFAVRSK